MFPGVAQHASHICLSQDPHDGVRSLHPAQKTPLHIAQLVASSLLGSLQSTHLAAAPPSIPPPSFFARLVGASTVSEAALLSLALVGGGACGKATKDGLFQALAMRAAKTLSEPFPLAPIHCTQYFDRAAEEKNRASSISTPSEFTPITSRSFTTRSELASASSIERIMSSFLSTSDSNPVRTLGATSASFGVPRERRDIVVL
mmetsp:Transcript_64180/g.126061  ORF Transcript_64180/g.126061 Transcript_64180/m.126061 type:complete len:203 (+) Transcript_64180:548-1156(+)